MSNASNLFSEEDEQAFEEAIEKWGVDAQFDMATEESGELIVALSRYMRGRNNSDDIIDELADVRIMYEQLSRFIGQDRVEDRVEVKMDRLRERLEDE